MEKNRIQINGVWSEMSQDNISFLQAFLQFLKDKSWL